MKYKVLKPCVIDHKYFEEGDTWEWIGDSNFLPRFLQELIKHKVIQKKIKLSSSLGVNDIDNLLAWRKNEAVLFEDTGYFRPNWHDKNQAKYAVVWDRDKDLFIVNRVTTKLYPGPIFASDYDAWESVYSHRDKWKAYLEGWLQ